MVRVMVVALINMLLGLIVGKGLSIYYTEQIWPVISIAVFLCLIITAVTWLLIRPMGEDLKKAEDELKEGEVYVFLRFCNRRKGEDGVVVMARSEKTKELKRLVFEKIPPLFSEGISPLFFKKENGKIVEVKEDNIPHYAFCRD
ncbi:MAG: hypothetical protein Q7S81_00190 [bacterium]|nr:hypothetical protein [bacterium]